MTSRYLTVPTFDTLTAQIIAAMQTVLTTWSADESDPGVYWSDETAQRFITMLNDFNDSADASWVPRATGGALTELLANVNLQAVAGNTVEQERERYYQAWSALTRETAEYLDQITRNALTTMIGGVAIRFEDADRDANRLVAFIVDPMGDDLGATDRATLLSLYNDPLNHPVWLDWFLGWVKPVNYGVVGTIILTENVSAVQAEVRERLEAEVAQAQKLGETLYASRFIEAARADDERVVDAQLMLADDDGAGTLTNPAASKAVDLGTGAPSMTEPAADANERAEIGIGIVAPTGTDGALNIVFTQA